MEAVTGDGEQPNDSLRQTTSFPESLNLKSALVAAKKAPSDYFIF